MNDTQIVLLAVRYYMSRLLCTPAADSDDSEDDHSYTWGEELDDSPLYAAEQDTDLLSRDDRIDFFSDFPPEV